MGRGGDRERGRSGEGEIGRGGDRERWRWGEGGWGDEETEGRRD